MNQVCFAEPNPQLITCVGLENRRGQYVLRSVRAMHLPRVAYVLEPWLAWWFRGFEADGHDDVVAETSLVERGSRGALSLEGSTAPVRV